MTTTTASSTLALAQVNHLTDFPLPAEQVQIPAEEEQQQQQQLKNYYSFQLLRDLRANHNNNNEEMVREIQSKFILHWNYRNLTEIPPEIFTSIGLHLKEFYLKRNQLTRIPREISKLANLTNLYLNGNQLVEIPEEIGQLGNLRVLDLSQNGIECLPGSIGELCQLEQLILTENYIRELPEELASCPLKLLESSSNLLTHLSPKLINGLASTLEEFGLDRNPLKALPRNIRDMKCLQYLSTCQCQLNYLPSSLALASSMNELLTLQYDGNPCLNYLPADIMKYHGSNYGCSTKKTPPPPPALPTIKIKFINRAVTDNSSEILHFDPDIQQIHNRACNQPISLVETCLRAVSESKATVNLPVHLSRTLYLGPTAACCLCNAPTYTELWLKLYNATSTEFNIKLMTRVFCSFKCYNRNCPDATHLNYNFIELEFNQIE